MLTMAIGSHIFGVFFTPNRVTIWFKTIFSSILQNFTTGFKLNLFVKLTWIDFRGVQNAGPLHMNPTETFREMDKNLLST